MNLKKSETLKFKYSYIDNKNMCRYPKGMKEPKLGEEALKDIMQARLEAKEGKVIPIEKIYKEG